MSLLSTFTSASVNDFGTTPNTALGFVLKTTLTADLPKNGDAFGTSMALSKDGTTLAILSTETYAYTQTASPFGKGTSTCFVIYVYTYANGVWSKQTKISPAQIAETGSFSSYVVAGNNLTISDNGNKIVLGVGGWNDKTKTVTDPNWHKQYQGGKIYVFDRSGTTWSQTYSLVNPTTEYNAATPYVYKFSYFGQSVAISENNTIVVGSMAGASSLGLNIPGLEVAQFVIIEPTKTTVIKSPYNYTSASGIGPSCFGLTVNISGDGSTIITSALEITNNGIDTNVNCHLYKKNTSGIWVLDSTFRPTCFVPNKATIFDIQGLPISYDGSTIMFGTETYKKINGNWAKTSYSAQSIIHNAGVTSDGNISLRQGGLYSENTSDRTLIQPLDGGDYTSRDASTITDYVYGGTGTPGKVKIYSNK